MGTVELAFRIVAAAILVAGFATVSYWAAARLRPGSVLARWGAVPVVGMALATLAFHVLMPLRLFRLPVALAALALALAAVFAPAANRRLLVETFAIDRRFVRHLARLLARTPGRGWIVAGLVLAVPVVARPFFVPPVAWDFTMYHGVKAAFWVQNGGAPALNLDPGVASWLLARNHLAGGDVFLAWAMLPMSGDLYAGLVSAVQWVGLGLMLVLLAREVGVRGAGATIAAAFVLSLNPVRLQVGSGYVEITLAITLAATLVYALRYMRTGCVGSLVVACAAVGLACAVKIVALPIAAVMLVAVSARALARRQVTPLAASVLLAVALAAPWFVYNYLDTGGPLSPASVKLFGMPIGFTNDAYRHIFALEMPKPYRWGSEGKAFWTTFGSISSSRETAGWAVVVSFAFFLVALPMFARRRPWAALLLTVVVVANVAVVYNFKFSAWRLLAPENASRFWLAAIVVIVPLSALALRLPVLGPAYQRFLLAFAIYDFVRLALVGVAPFEVDDFMIALAVGAVVTSLLRALRAPRAVWAVVALAGLIVIGAHRETHRDDAFKKSQFLHGLHRNWADPALTLDDGAPHRIAVTHGMSDFVDNGMFYFLLGRSLQNRLLSVRVTRDGSAPLDPRSDPDNLDYERWLGRLEAERVDHVMSMHPATVELEWMDAHPDRFRKVHGSKGSWGLYELLPRPR